MRNASCMAASGRNLSTAAVHHANGTPGHQHCSDHQAGRVTHRRLHTALLAGAGIVHMQVLALPSVFCRLSMAAAAKLTP